ncbi:MAG: hypothetical protein H6709_24975, partial [Kofleriaceae bacterium]|nr:hypothetical protein [Kofleriaceae bacterium]
MDLEQLEALALADDRDAVLAQLLPGTEDHDYWRGVHLQHAGRLDEVDDLLAGWAKRHGHGRDAHTRLARRQRLLRAGASPAEHADAIRFEVGLALDDQAEAEAAAQRLPTALDPALIDAAALVRDALGRASDLSYVTDDALADLVLDGVALSTSQRRHLLQRLGRANLAGLVALIAADLDERSSPRFGQLAVHRWLTLAQLEELATLRPALQSDAGWVDAVLARLRPPAHVEWQHDLAARAAHLDHLWQFAAELGPAFATLKATILYHRLDVDRRRGALDDAARARLLTYLALPRRVGYVDPAWLRRFSGDQVAQPGAAIDAAGLAAIGDDEPLVRELLEHFLATDDGDDLARHLRSDWVDEVRAVARLLAGAADPDRWAAVLGPSKLAALRDRVDIELTARNPEVWAADAPVVLEVDVKNVPRLTVKVFRIDAVAYFLARGREVDTSLDLDGMVAGDESVITSDEPPMRRQRRRLELAGCARPGTYVVELIGNGRSSRALVRKGGLRHTVRVGAAGPVVRVHDEAGRPVPDARLWLGGRELTPRDDGAITVPFSTHPQAAPILLVHGDVTSREVLDHPA